jgi:hypothetical protein
MPGIHPATKVGIPPHPSRHTLGSGMVAAIPDREC